MSFYQSRCYNDVTPVDRGVIQSLSNVEIIWTKSSWCVCKARFPWSVFLERIRRRFCLRGTRPFAKVASRIVASSSSSSSSPSWSPSPSPSPSPLPPSPSPSSSSSSSSQSSPSPSPSPAPSPSSSSSSSSSSLSPSSSSP